MSHHTRRQFVTAASGFTAATVIAPASLALAQKGVKPLRRAGTFAEGVASGDPTTNAISLWTRLSDVERRGTVQLEVARDKSFKRVVARSQIVTGPEVGGAIKARVTGLTTREQYFYRFSTPDRQSIVGRFRTAPPAGSTDKVNFAFWSCQDYTWGFYNGHARMAEEDLDFVVCLGDYIYAESYHSTKTDGVRTDGIGKPYKVDANGIVESNANAISLKDYRDKYALYRSDPSLRAVHANFPMITIWDDHEVQNNYAGAAGPKGGLPDRERFTKARQAAGYRAFFESNPTFSGVGKSRNRIYRKVSYGGAVDLFMLDQRQYRDDQPCDDVTAGKCDTVSQPRDFLGREQMKWFKSELSKSKAAWKVIGNEMTIAPTKLPGGNRFTVDAWDGYQAERDEVLAHIKSADLTGEVCFITGDIHTFFAADVREKDGAGETVAFEFVGGSITSQGLGEIDLAIGGGAVIKGNKENPKTPQSIIDVLRAINPWVDQADFDHHGYAKVEATRATFDVDFVALDTVRKKSKTLFSKQLKWSLERGKTTSLVGQQS